MPNFKDSAIAICLSMLLILCLGILAVESHSLLNVDTPVFKVTLDSRP